ncbi:hypothetical protein CN378_12795 [Bacillus sp. AFS015802]|nr:hypothetical protein CN378_12795 [Bacillus sp. AFS015802]
MERFNKDYEYDKDQNFDTWPKVLKCLNNSLIKAYQGSKRAFFCFLIGVLLEAEVPSPASWDKGPVPLSLCPKK